MHEPEAVYSQGEFLGSGFPRDWGTPMSDDIHEAQRRAFARIQIAFGEMSVIHAELEALLRRSKGIEDPEEQSALQVQIRLRHLEWDRAYVRFANANSDHAASLKGIFDKS